MVYESDFYTTRRPYRPSSYSVTTPIRYFSSIPRLQTIQTYYPHHVNKLVLPPITRLVTSSAPPHHVMTVRVRPAVILRELDRIVNRHRPALAYSATEDFLSSDSSKKWEDETRRIRADTASLLQRVQATTPRPLRVMPSSLYSTYYDSVLPIRISNDDYVNRLLLPVRNVANNIKNISWYAEPAKRFTGRGHLASVRYSGNKAFSNRKSLYSDLSVKDDVNLLSFYVKNRLAAAGLATESVTVKLLPSRASRKFQAPSLMEDPALELKAAKAERLEKFKAGENTTVPETDFLAERKKKRQEESKLAEEKALAEELAKKKEEAKKAEEARAAELARQEQLASQAAAERAAEIERKAELAKQAENEAEEARKVEQARLEEEAKAAEAARLAEETKAAAKAKIAEDAKKAEEERIAAEQEEIRKTELARLEELEKQAAEEKEAELARQAAELAEIARQESELAALAKQEAELAELAKQEEELAELQRQEAELAILEAEAQALAASASEGLPSEEPEESNADQSSPIIQEPESDNQAEADNYTSEGENIEAEVTDEEE